MSRSMLPSVVLSRLLRRRLGAAAAALAMVGTVAMVGTDMSARLASAPLAVHVVGNHLVDGGAAPLTLRGVNLSGTEFACDQGGTASSRGWSIYGGQPIDQPSTYAAMAAWHVNVVRVPLNEDCWLGINGVNPAYSGATYRSAIAQEVALIHQAGMYAILDLHWTAPGPYAAVAQNPMADADHSIAFWSSVATAYRNDPAVLFDLFNEPFLYGSYMANPNQDPWQCLLNGCAMVQFVSGNGIGPNGQSTGYTTTYSWTTAGMQQLVTAIRQAGATQPVIVNGLDWSNDLSGWLAHVPSDPAGQLVAGAHDYPGESCQTTTCWDSIQAPISTQYPFLVGETGDHVSPPVSFLPTFLPYAEAHAWNYLAWTWNPWSNPDDVLITDWTGTPNAGEGTYYRQWLLQHASAPLPSGSTPTPTAAPTPSPSATPTPTSTSTPTPTPSPAGGSSAPVGINAVVSTRPWHGNYMDPEGWWAGAGAVNPDGTPAKSVFSDPLGQIGREMDGMAALHVNVVREEFPWFDMERQKGVFDFTRADVIVNDAAQRGLTMLPVVWTTPLWEQGSANLAPTNTQDFADFMTAFMNHFKGRLHYVELWNEPDGGNYWTSGWPSWVSTILVPGYRAVKSVDPSVGVLISPSYYHQDWYDAVFNNGGGNSFDLAGYHDYVNSASTYGQQLRTYLQGKGRGGVPIWVGEAGAQEASNTTNDTNHQSLVNSFVPPVMNGTASYNEWIMYAYKDDAVLDANGNLISGSKYWGMVQEDGVTTKQSYAMLRAMLAGSGPGPSPTPTPAPSPTPTPTIVPTPLPTPTPTPTATSTPIPTGTPSPTPGSGPPGAVLFSDSFSQDSAGAVPTGWSVYGANGGWAIEASGQQKLYAHNGWAASTCAGSLGWSNYTLSVDVRPNAWQSEVNGVDVRYRDAKDFYSLRFVGGTHLTFGRSVNDGSWSGSWTSLASTPFTYSGSSVYHVSISVNGSSYSVAVNGTTLMAVSDSTILSGAIGFDANSPVAYDNVTVTAF